MTLNKTKTLSGRREFLFLYDIKMGNPNGDPDENRPRVLPDGTYYVTDVRMKRFVRDFLKMRGFDILVDTIEGRTTNLTGRVVHYLNTTGNKKVEGKALVDILLNAFIDARLFGSSFAFKKEKDDNWDPKPEPKTMTGAVQLNMGEILHKAESVDIHGTTTFGSDELKTQGTFTVYYGLRYALIGFSGIANEHSARISRMSDEDYDLFLKALWHGVRANANTRTKVGQIPHLLISIEYKADEEFQFGRLHEYVRLIAATGKEEKVWASPEDYKVDLSKLHERIQGQQKRIERIRYAKSTDISLLEDIPVDWRLLEVEELLKDVGSV
ncbi:type I-B CRISPR-associated protein Cas7/Csh2 [Desulforamulus ruminis]|uniref:CRISPR-associated protein, Csh2 family n=1 Tax=Desulforamulus ruminis (strain ATCC 23193 / DSM 2154 / NCIMB 8452 / DL) TaxID=696281 RepID=F6DTN8_DESRL|nr:type I-B CRISPR-associated protein Cas7/Csh2 [Desulforamulus ruminis]AEG61212.1 CRISPR-associated protein, Csh2 family [Desulforamulus ruminis DSM 2154]